MADGALLAACALLLTSCGSAGAETDDGGTDPSSAEETDASEGEESADEDGGSGEDPGGAEGASGGGEGDAVEADEADAGEGFEEDLEPVPASSEGPAENWSEPEIPDEIYEETEEGVEAALEYWWEARQYARNTGDTSPLEDASHENCALCNQQVERVEEAYGGDGWYVQELDEVLDSFIRIEQDDFATGVFTLKQGAFDTYWDGEFYSERESRGETGWSATFQYDAGNWVVRVMKAVGEAEDSAEEQS